MSADTSSELRLIALGSVPLIRPGDDLAQIILAALKQADLRLMPDDAIVLAQKIVSKAEGRLVALESVQPGARAQELARDTHKDPRIVELILSESQSVLRATRGVIIVQHRLGYVMANAGIDQSNIAQSNGEHALLLPENPDASCARLRAELERRSGVNCAVLIIDSVGRAWRNGTVGMALGVSGLPGLLDLRGKPDLYGRPLQSSELGLADEVAASASLIMGQADEARPIVLARGIPYPRRESSATELVRPSAQDLFR